jgi:hypothetical protein
VVANKQRNAGKAVVDQAGEKVKAAEVVAKQAWVECEKATKEKEVEVARMWKEVQEARVRSGKALADAAAAKVSAARRLPTARTHSSVSGTNSQTRFAASLRTDNSPQRKETRPLFFSYIQLIQ